MGKTLQRRAFLKCGAAGVAASVSGCAPGLLRGGAAPPSTSLTAAPTASPDSTADSAVADVPGVLQTDIDPALLQAETWQEPWTWRPDVWPDAQLHLNVTRNQNPGRSPSPGNPRPSLFSYNGSSPGPTVRVRGDGTLRAKVRNTLGLDEDMTHVGPGPDLFELPGDLRRSVCARVEAEVLGGDPESPSDCVPFFFPEQALAELGLAARAGWSIKGHLNGAHATHVTNLHTHGLHVHPGRNPDGTYSDDVMLRVLPLADWEARRASDDPDLHTLAPHERVGEADYVVRLSGPSDGTPAPHPPGTHWYHPHAHGATHVQVASGMAGFLIVEGDVDEAVNSAVAGEPWPDPEVKTGPYEYRERLVFLQRVFVGSFDPDAGPRRNELRFPPLETADGPRSPDVSFMRPGAVERWRVLNASVDGSGTKRFMVLRGQFVFRRGRLWRVARADGEGTERRLEQVSERDLEAAKIPLHQLAFDGITLVTTEGGEARHTVRDLSRRGHGGACPLVDVPEEGDEDARAALRAYEACFRDGEALRASFVRPNEVYLTNASRVDLFVKAPLDAGGETLTVVAREALLNTDTYQRTLQIKVAGGGGGIRRTRHDVVAGYVHVRGEPVEGGDLDVGALANVLPPVPPLFRPIGEDELRVPPDEARRTGAPAGSARTRTVAYTGIGGTDFPSLRAPDVFVRTHPELENLVWVTHDGVPSLMPSRNGTMAIHADFDLRKTPSPSASRKFMPHDPEGTRVLVGSAEEWALLNTTMPLWAHTDRERFPQPGSYRGMFVSYPLTRAEGQRRFWEDPEFRITTMGADHPFHIHVNPMWVLRVEVPDETGALHNVLPEPQWMDTVPIPRAGGRVVFRTRFDDFVGTWVHHCHVLLHEDLGMMQTVECSDDPARANYTPRAAVATAALSGAAADAVYPRPSLEVMYRQNVSFVDPNELGGQTYPGFDIEVPRLADG